MNSDLDYSLSIVSVKASLSFYFIHIYCMMLVILPHLPKQGAGKLRHYKMCLVTPNLEKGFQGEKLLLTKPF